MKAKENMEKGDYKDRLPHGTKGTYDDMISLNRSPKVAYAGIYYCLNDISQQEVADKFNLAIQTVRSAYQMAVVPLKNANLELEIMEQGKGYGKTIKELQKEIIGEVDLKESKDYKVITTTNQSGSDQEMIRFNKSAWRKINSKLVKN